MNIPDFENILKQGEGITTEFKRCGSQPESDTYETICAFANRQGGNIFLGVLDDGTIAGVSKEVSLDIQRNLINCVKNPNLFNAPPPIELEEIVYNDVLIIRIWVTVGPFVHKYKNVVYDRVADVDTRVQTDTQLSAMYIRKQEYYSERKVYRYLSQDDLRLDLLPRVRELAVQKRSNHPWGELDDFALLKSANLYLKDYDTGEEGFTLAAALLLGRDDVIASIAPSYKTDAYVQRDNLDRYDDRVIVKTNLIEAYDFLLGFAQKHLDDKFFLEGTHTISLRDIIARELISNTLVHREYTNPYPAKLIIDNVGLSTENASRPRFVGQLTPDRFNPLPKNPIIADFFANIGRADTLGSGTRNLFKYSWAYGGADPVLTEGDIFRAHLPLLQGQEASTTKKLDVDDVIFRMIRDYGYATLSGVASVAGVTERTVSRHISPLVEQGRLETIGNTRSRRFVLANKQEEL